MLPDCSYIFDIILIGSSFWLQKRDNKVFTKYVT